MHNNEETKPRQYKNKNTRPTNANYNDRLDKLEATLKICNFNFIDVFEYMNNWLVDNNRPKISERTMRDDLSVVQASLEEVQIGEDAELKPIYGKVYKINDEDEATIKAEKRKEYIKILKELSNETVKDIDVYVAEKFMINDEMELMMEDEAPVIRYTYEIYVRFYKKVLYQETITNILYDLYSSKIYMISEGRGGIIIHLRPLRSQKKTAKEIITLLSQKPKIFC